MATFHSMYTPFFVCPFPPQLVFGDFFSKKCVKITEKLISSLEHMPIMHDSFHFYRHDTKYENC